MQVEAPPTLPLLPVRAQAVCADGAGTGARAVLGGDAAGGQAVCGRAPAAVPGRQAEAAEPSDRCHGCSLRRQRAPPPPTMRGDCVWPPGPLPSARCNPPKAAECEHVWYNCSSKGYHHFTQSVLHFYVVLF